MKTTEKVVGTGIGLAVVAALGAYFLYSNRDEKNPGIIAGWILKMKGEVLEKVEEIKDINEAEYYKIVDEVSAHYAKLGKVGAEELKHMTSELKGAWAHIAQQFK